jgi:precorrin-6B methylase 2
MNIKETLIKYFRTIYLIQNVTKRLILKKDSFLYQSGWINSILENKPVQKDNHYIPWINYSFFTFIDSRISDDQNVFEYGAGYSSIYFSKTVKKLYSVEHDPTWIEKIKSQSRDNHVIYNISEIENKQYAQSIKRPLIKFDIVFVDGRDRVDCSIYSVSYLSDRGVLILDDSERGRYTQVFVFMKENGFKELTFTSFKPSMNKLASTTIFYKSDNCFNI